MCCFPVTVISHENENKHENKCLVSFPHSCICVRMCGFMFCVSGYDSGSFVQVCLHRHVHTHERNKKKESYVRVCLNNEYWSCMWLSGGADEIFFPLCVMFLFPVSTSYFPFFAITFTDLSPDSCRPVTCAQ